MSMTNASIKNVFAVLSVIAVSLALSMGAFAIIAHADDSLGYYDTPGDNLGWYDTPGDNLGYYDTTGNNLGWYDTPGDSLGYYDTSGSNLGYYDTPGSVYTGCDTCVYDNGIQYDYVDYGYNDYYTPSYGYSMPSFNFSAPRSYYSNPVVYQQPVQHPVQQQQQQQQQQGGGPINIVNNNTNTNTNTNVVSAAAPATTSVVPITTIQYPVQYVYPQTYTYPTYYNYPTYPQQNLYCYISSSHTSVAPGQSVYLSWSAPGATSAYLTGVGSVNPNGSITVNPSVSTTYTLTVYGGYNYGYNYNYNYGYNNYGYGGSNTCSTYVSISAPYYYNTPSVSLSQIPYTGIDFGVFGDTMYWLALLAFALAGSYLLVYYRGGALALATAMVARPVRGGASNGARKAQAPVQAVKTAAKHIEQKVVEPVRATLKNLPVFEKQTTSDTMTRVASKGNEAPRIVITRD